MQPSNHQDRRRLYPWAGVLAGLVLVVAAAWAADFIPGDVNDDGVFDIADPTVLRRELQQLVTSLYRLGDFQRRGLEAIPESNGSSNVLLRDDVKAILSDLQEFGLFLVPVGELESWLPILMKGHSREDKSRWAILAADMIEDVGERDEDVWKFIRAAYNFLQKQTGALVEAS